jgi:Succinylglutamate desuccinylase / Aspartoacylase family
MSTNVATASTDRTIHRSFARDVVRPLNDLPNAEIETIARIEYDDRSYPLFVIKSVVSLSDRPTVLVSGGVHGDEPAGVYAALDFVEHLMPRFRFDFNFFVLPCANPSGFEMDTLQSLSGANLNRLFDTGSAEPEIRGIEDWLMKEPARFLATFDLHETVPEFSGEGFTARDNPHACYLYETVRGRKKRFGKQLIESLPPSFDVCRWSTIYADINSDGVISYPEANRNLVYAQETTFEAFLMHHKTDHAFTTETPTGWSIEKRVQAQLQWLETALRILKG